MFKNSVARFFLQELNVSPVYRFEEGLENVHKNLETFKGIYSILKQNGNYVVFSEGICVQLLSTICVPEHSTRREDLWVYFRGRLGIILIVLG